MAEDRSNGINPQEDRDKDRDPPVENVARETPDIPPAETPGKSADTTVETASTADAGAARTTPGTSVKDGNSRPADILAVMQNWTVRDIFQRTLLSFWLLFLYIVLIFFVVLSFSAYQFHLEVARSRTSDDKPVSISLVLDTRDSRRSIQDQLSFTYEQIFINNNRIARNNDLLTKYYARRDEIYDTCKSQIQKIFKLDYKSDFDIKLIRCNENDATIASRVALPAEARNAQVDSAKSTAKEYLDQVSDIQMVLDPATKERNAALSENVILYANIDKIKKQREELFAASKIGEISTFVNQADFFDRSKFDTFARLILPDFLIMPTDTLVLIIVISMGALGGAIQITRNFLSAEDLSNIDTYRIRYRYIFFQPFLGAITALAIFILFKAGVMVVSSNVAGGEEAGLNPFFISFLGIISGLMANVALDTIIKVGENWFRSSSQIEKARWAINLGGQIDDMAKRSADESSAQLKSEIATVLGVPEAEVTAWISQAKPVPDQFQKLIAVFLRKKEWELFTDIPLKRDAGAV